MISSGSEANPLAAAAGGPAARPWEEEEAMALWHLQGTGWRTLLRSVDPEQALSGGRGASKPRVHRTSTSPRPVGWATREGGSAFGERLLSPLVGGEKGAEGGCEPDEWLLQRSAGGGGGCASEGLSPNATPGCHVCTMASAQLLILLKNNCTHATPGGQGEMPQPHYMT